MYSLIKQCLFTLHPEHSHTIALKSLYWANKLKLLRHSVSAQPSTCMGLNFPNKIGLAAGLDKNADYVEALAALGFGFIEIGTVTPKPQSGNPKPRLFRLVKEEAIINRMGFNSKGMDYVASQLAKTHYRGILGINLGKNRDTPLENAIDDYLLGFKALWKYASYIAINISSPNTPGLRNLQQEDRLRQLLNTLKKEQQHIFHTQNKYVPLVVKIAPDMNASELIELAHVLLNEKIDGVIATNTTTHRPGITHSAQANEAGGLSGKPLKTQSTLIIQQLQAELKNQIPIIAVGGIMDEASAKEKYAAGASLLQIYTGFIYEGPRLIARLSAL